MHRRSMNPRLRHHEVVILVLNWNKAETVLTSYGFDGQAPVSATLRYCRCNAMMGVGLRLIALLSVTGKQTVDQNPRAASRIAAYHQASGMPPRRRKGGLCGEPVKPPISRSEDNPLHATVTANE